MKRLMTGTFVVASAMALPAPAQAQECFIGEVRMFAGNFAPRGWALAYGQLLPIAQNTALFSILGTTYGGNGQTTFALPNLMGRVPLHFADITLGTSAGAQSHTVTTAEMPSHIHPINARDADADASAQVVPPGPSVVFARAFAVPVGGGKTVVNRHGQGAVAGTFRPEMITNTGGSQAHENRQPYLTLNFCIALQGIFPSRN